MSTAMRERTGYEEDEEHGYVYSNGRKRGEKRGLWEDLLDWVVFDVL